MAFFAAHALRHDVRAELLGIAEGGKEFLRLGGQHGLAAGADFFRRANATKWSSEASEEVELASETHA